MVWYTLFILVLGVSSCMTQVPIDRNTTDFVIRKSLQNYPEVSEGFYQEPEEVLSAQAQVRLRYEYKIVAVHRGKGIMFDQECIYTGFFTNETEVVFIPKSSVRCRPIRENESK